jgi:hypothetical protein
MDRNGKKPKASTAVPNGERSDLKASARGSFGEGSADARGASGDRVGKAREVGRKSQPRGRTS